MDDRLAQEQEPLVRVAGGAPFACVPRRRASSMNPRRRRARLQRAQCRWPGVGNGHENRTDPGGERADRCRLSAESSVGHVIEAHMRELLHSGTLSAMVTITRTFLVDDLHGAHFEIDLSAVNAGRLREKLTKYVEHGTRVTPQRTRQTRRTVKPGVRAGSGPSGAGLGSAERVHRVGPRAHPHGIQEAFAAAH